MIPWYEIRGRRSLEKHPDPPSLNFVMFFNAVWEARVRTAHGALCVVVCADDAGGVILTYVRLLVLHGMAFLLGTGWLVTEFVPAPAWIYVTIPGSLKSTLQLPASKHTLQTSASKATLQDLRFRLVYQLYALKWRPKT